MNALPEKPKPPPNKEKEASWLAVGFVVVFFSGAAAALLWMPLGVFGPVIILGGLFFTVVIGLHYFIWGHWVTRMIEEERQRAEDQDSES